MLLCLYIPCMMKNDVTSLIWHCGFTHIRHGQCVEINDHPLVLSFGYPSFLGGASRQAFRMALIAPRGMVLTDQHKINFVASLIRGFSSSSWGYPKLAGWFFFCGKILHTNGGWWRRGIPIFFGKPPFPGAGISLLLGICRSHHHFTAISVGDEIFPISEGDVKHNGT